MDAKLTPERADVLVQKLRANLGFGLKRDDVVRLLKNAPLDAYGLTNAVFAAEGLNPETSDPDLWRQVRHYVVASFDVGTRPEESSQYHKDE